MKFLILNTDYPEFLEWLYVYHEGLEKEPFEKQLGGRMECLCGMADFYSGSLCRLGHEAWDIHANNEFIERVWARDHGVLVEATSVITKRLQHIRLVAKRVAGNVPRHLRRIVASFLRSLNSLQPWFYLGRRRRLCAMGPA